jgi:hypothetical protein
LFAEKRIRIALPSAMALLVLLAASVGVQGASGGLPSPNDAGAVLPCPSLTAFDRSAFWSPTRINNQYLPLVPGWQYTLQGQANRGGGLLPHTVVLTVTDVTKVINGVKTLVVWDVDENEDEVQEAELAFFAQDNSGNVWALGEYPEEYEDGRLMGAPNTWIAGLNADAGIAMAADPEVGLTYHQGFAPGIDFLDCATVTTLSGTGCVPAGCFSNQLVTDETSPLSDEPNAHQQKYYAPGIGNVQIGATDDPEGETLVLVSRVKLERDELEDARGEVIHLDRRGYYYSALYRKTQPARLPW